MDRKRMTELKIAYSYFESTQNLDPANIQTLYESNLIENLYSRLIEYDSKGQISCVLCKEFWIENDSIVFELRSGIKTKDGYEISAKDAEISLRRLFNLNSNTHGNLLNFIRNETDIHSDGKLLKIKLIKNHYSQFILPLLTSMDFSIVPAISINEKNLIKNHVNTSGPYYIKQDSPTGQITLASNIDHPFYSKDMFETIELIPTQTIDAVNFFIDGKVDVIDITNYPRTNLYESLFIQKNKKFNFIKTIPINLFLLMISPNARLNFSQSQLFYALSIIRNKYLEFKTYGYGFEQSIEFFPKNGNGQLSSEEHNQIEQLRSNKDKPTFSIPIKLGVLKSSFDKLSLAFKDHTEIQVVSYDQDPSFLPSSKRPDIIIQTTDSSFNEDVSLLSYNFSMEYFGLTKEEGARWLKGYIDIEDKHHRIQKLQELQLDFLKKPAIYSIGASPYWAISREDIDLNFSSLFPGSHWWKIRNK